MDLKMATSPLKTSEEMLPLQFILYVINQIMPEHELMFLRSSMEPNMTAAMEHRLHVAPYMLDDIH